MEAKLRIQCEYEMARAVISDMLAAGYAVQIDNGAAEDEDFPPPSTDKEKLFAAVRETDQEYILAFQDDTPVGWVFMVYGELGWDTVADYTVNLESIFNETKKVFEKYAPEGMEWN